MLRRRRHRRIHPPRVPGALLLALLFVGAAVAGCGTEPAGPGTPDGAAPADGAPAPDGALPLPDGSAPDLSADGSFPDLLADRGADPDAGPGELEAEGPYPVARHSPLSPRVVRRVRAILAEGQKLGRRADVFMKVGASNTATAWFLACFAPGGRYDLDGRDELQPVLDYFNATVLDADGATSFDRESLAATPGWHVASVTTPGESGQSPLDQEIQAISPGWALILLGTNDVNITGVRVYEERMSALVADLASRGIVPILSTIPPRLDALAREEDTRELNAVLRAIARAEDLPLIDLHFALADVPGLGLNDDGIHLTPYSPSTCTLTAEGLERGFPVRNLVTLEALARLLRVLDGDGSSAIEPAPPPFSGDGTLLSPLALPSDPAGVSLAFTDDTTRGEARVARYDCALDRDESGPELAVVFRVEQPVRARFAVYDRDGVDVDLHVLTEDGAALGDGTGCLARHDQRLDLELLPGRYRLVLDSFAVDGMPQPGPFRAVAVELP